MIAKLRDGTEIKICDEVTTIFKGCVGHTFVVCEINPYQHCESKFMVAAHLKGFPDRVIKSPFAGKDGRPNGMDSNWYSLLKKEI